MGTSEGTSHTGLGMDLLSSSSQDKSGSGLVQVWLSVQLKFASLELDSEVERLVKTAVASR